MENPRDSVFYFVCFSKGVSAAKNRNLCYNIFYHGKRIGERKNGTKKEAIMKLMRIVISRYTGKESSGFLILLPRLWDRSSKNMESQNRQKFWKSAAVKDGMQLTC